MATLFSHPPHPSELLLRKLKTDETTQSHEQPSHSFSPPDPHQIPIFDSKRVLPVLYLPPLLSSLPITVLPEPVETKYPPLTTEAHLPYIDPASLSLHRALRRFRPLNENYATLPYDEAFNWAELELPRHEERAWYCVVFRSKRRPGSDGGRE